MAECGVDGMELEWVLDSPDAARGKPATTPLTPADEPLDNGWMGVGGCGAGCAG